MSFNQLFCPNKVLLFCYYVCYYVCYSVTMSLFCYYVFSSVLLSKRKSTRSIFRAFCSGEAWCSRTLLTRIGGESSQKGCCITRSAASCHRLYAIPSGSVSGNRITLSPLSGRNLSTCTSPSPPAASHTYCGYNSDRITAVFSASTTAMGDLSPCPSITAIAVSPPELGGVRGGLNKRS